MDTHDNGHMPAREVRVVDAGCEKRGSALPMLRAVEKANRQIDRKAAIGTGQSGRSNIGPRPVGNHGDAAAPIDVQKDRGGRDRTLDIRPTPATPAQPIDMAAQVRKDAVAVHHSPAHRSGRKLTFCERL